MKLIDSKLIENISCEDVTENELQEVFDQSKEMYDLIKYERKAIGIAAPQVGIFKKFFIYKTSPTSYTLVINPVYVKNGPEIKSKESCLSYGINNWKVVKRFKSIRVKSYSVKDDILVKEMHSINYPLSVIFQHEIDHLNGRTIFNV